MTLRNLIRLWLIAMLSFVLVACGSDDSSNDDSDTPNIETTEEAVTDTTDTTENVTLAQTISTTDAAGGVLSLNYPDSWFAEQFAGAITLSNSDATATSENLVSGQLIGSLLILPVADIGIEGESSAETVLTTFIEDTVTIAQDAEFVLNDLESFQANGNSAVIQTGTGTDPAGTVDIANIVVDIDGNFVLISFLAPEGEMAQYDATLRALAGAVSYDFPEAEG